MPIPTDKLNELQRRLAELTTVQRVARAINSTLDLDAIFLTVVRQITMAFSYQMVSIYLREGDGLRLQAYLGYEEVIEFIRLDQGVSGRVARTGQPVFVSDADQDPDFISVRPGARQAIIVPLKNGDGQVLGTLAADRYWSVCQRDWFSHAARRGPGRPCLAGRPLDIGRRLRDLARASPRLRLAARRNRNAALGWR